MKPHYFDQEEADLDDTLLSMAKSQGCVTGDCLLGGAVVMAAIRNGDSPCWMCRGPREKCGGKENRGD